ncbi:MAG: hypothetical protein WC710_14210 [Gallionella sp.]|jgi:hypothetical protein
MFNRGEGRRACPRCSKCYNARTDREDLCPDCRTWDKKQEYQLWLVRERTDSGLPLDALFVVKFEDHDWQLAGIEIAETIRMGYFPPDVPVIFRGRVGHMKVTEKHQVWQPMEAK